MSIGKEMYSLVETLFPINRSLTGEGVRKTLEIIQNQIFQLEIKSVQTGEKFFDWTIPKEWQVKDAYILTPDGRKICDFQKNNLHLVGYSTPVDVELSLDQLQQHLHSLPEQPDAIPYITSYYKEYWGFCISHQERENLKKGAYKVVINSDLFFGELNYGELILRGTSEEEVLLSTYICHPSMANNELSGPVVTTFLAKWLNSLPNRKYTYRFIFIPETIGVIAYLALNLQHLKKKVVAGYNVSCVGDDRTYSYLPSRNGSTISDKVALHTLKWVYPKFIRYDWTSRASNERQLCAPGVDLPIASIHRSKYGEYPEYHTSLDNLELVTPSGLEGAYNVFKRVIEILEMNNLFKAQVLCEPQLGKRGLYPTLSEKNSYISTIKIMELLTWADGQHDLIDIADKLKIPVWELFETVKVLQNHDLIA